jgi:hypothetical protein
MKTSISLIEGIKMVTQLTSDDFVIYEFPPESPEKRELLGFPELPELPRKRLGITGDELTVVLFTSGGLYSKQAREVFENVANREKEVEEERVNPHSEEIPNFNHSCVQWERTKRFKFCEIDVAEYGDVLIESLSTNNPLTSIPHIIAYNKGIPIGGVYAPRMDLTVFHINNFLDEMSHKLSFDVEENCHKRNIKLDEKKENQNQNQFVRILDVHFPADISDIILSYSTDSVGFKFGSIMIYTMLIVNGTQVTLG